MKLLTWILLALFSLSVLAQPVAKHPRVAELEEKLTDEGSKYFSQRFPNQPFFIKVEVTPLHTEARKADKTENLPYYEYESDESADEWDDPNVGIGFLRNRVKRIQIEVSVSNKMEDSEIQEIKDSLNVYLKLLPYRDEIKVERKLSKNFEIPQEIYYMAPFLLVALLGIGLWLRSSVKGIASSIKGAGGGAGGTISVSGGGGGGGSLDGKLSVQKVPPIRGDINFFDPIKMLEVLHLKIDQIMSSPSFPSLKDMVIFEKVAEDTPGALGALISEFPTDTQKVIFQLGRSQKWLEAFAFPATVDQLGIKALEEIARGRDFKKSDRDFENLIIQMWRLDDKLPVFIKDINSEHAFVLLAYLPKNVALKAAKKAFPGNWGRVLNEKPLNVVIDSNTLKDYYAKSVKMMPLLDYKILESFKKEKEILEYVRFASVEDERDIYETLPADSFVLKNRDPFYKIFEEDDVKFKSFVELSGLHDWALALINSPRPYIKRVLDSLDDKKRFVFSSALKTYDDNPPQPTEQMVMKEKLATQYKNLKASEVPAQTAETIPLGSKNNDGGNVESKSA
jgi:hypothetical protein